LEMAMGAEVNGQLIRMTEDNNDVLDLEHEVIDDNNDPSLRLSSE